MLEQDLYTDTIDLKDIEEVEEWNEYGELHEHVGSSAPPKSTPAPSAPNTPSKPPIVPTPAPSTSETSKAPAATSSTATTALSDVKPNAGPSTVGNDMASTMRQAGLEAAKKATDAKAKARAAQLETLRSKPEVDGMKDLKIGDASTSDQAEKSTSSSAEPPAKPGDEAPPEDAETLEGKGEAEEKIPNAKQAEEAANKAIIADESQHIHIAGSPPPVQRPTINQRIAEAEKEEDGPDKEAKVEDLKKEANDGSATPTEKIAPIALTQSNPAIEKDKHDEKDSEQDPEPTPEPGTKDQDSKPDKSTVIPLIQVEPAESSKDDVKSESKPTTDDPATSTSTTTTTTATANDPISSNPKISEIQPAAEDPKTTTTTHNDDSSHPPKPKTQDQPAASGDMAGETVAD